jgi:hypothetical protein
MFARLLRSTLLAFVPIGLAACADSQFTNPAPVHFSAACPGANSAAVYPLCEHRGGFERQLTRMMVSDMRLKEDIRLVGRTFDGLNVFTFHYKGDPVVRMGVMAQEVLKVHPEAVTEIDGYLAVDYSRIGATPMR